jgi:acetoacetyl-CoA synthetase
MRTFFFPGGIRFGSSEIYDTVDALQHPAICDSLVVGQSISGGADERVILFLQLHQGYTFDENLIKAVKSAIRQACVSTFTYLFILISGSEFLLCGYRRSPRHVPELVLQVNDVPHTINNKKGMLFVATSRAPRFYR